MNERAPVLTAAPASAPLIVHIVHRFDIGGLENGVVNLLNRLPPARYRHAVIALTAVTAFRERVQRADVEFLALDKKDGKDFAVYWRLWRLLRRLRPEIVHTRNLPTIDCQLIAALAGVPCRIHGEHGRDVADRYGASRKYLLLRRALRPFIHRYIPLSRELQDWLQRAVGIPSARSTRIYNGVDSERFQPAGAARAPLPLKDFAGPDDIVIGTVGRMAEVKDPLNLVRAFLRLFDRLAQTRGRLRLVMIGEGPLRDKALGLLQGAGVGEVVWLPGAREDIPGLLRAFDIFVLPSAAEGISNTILEAMASGLPVVATDVGGNRELVLADETGALVPAGDAEALCEALARYAEDAAMRKRHGRAGRRRIEREFSLPAMVDRYLAVYDAEHARRARRALA